LTAAGLNLEIKARDPAPGQTFASARALGAVETGTFFQTDTFFCVPYGRLKLRESDQGAELIEYERRDAAQAKPSVYHRLAVDDAGAVRELLAAELGVGAVVEKHRRLLVKNNIRIHLDRVRGLGTFVELEAVVPPGHRPEAELPRIKALRQALGISDDRLVAGAYADLLLESPSRQ
jgi:adenylate cyclase class 2